MQDRHTCRAWIKAEKRMGIVKSIDFWRNSIETLSKNDRLVVYRDLDEVELLQRTGLRDCNGNLTYFEDIARDKNGIIDVITWYQGFILFNGQAVTGRTEGDRLGYYMDELKIIGNKFENPELGGGR